MRQRQTDLSNLLNPGLWNKGFWDRRVLLLRQRGVTLLEMIVVITILLILMGAAVPILKVSVRRQREVELRRDLWEMGSAIARSMAWKLAEVRSFAFSAASRWIQ